MEKYLVFIDAADDAAMYPVSKIQSGSVDVVTLTVTADKELKVFKSIADAIAGNSFKPLNSYIVVADDVNGVYVDSDITACAIALDA